MLVHETQNSQQLERTLTQEYNDSLLKLQSDLDNKIAEQAGADTGTDFASKLLRGLTLLAAMVGHSFDLTCIPTNPLDIECPFCGHPSLNAVAEDDGMVPQNNAIHAEYGVLIAKWEQFEKDMLVTNNNGDPKTKACFSHKPVQEEQQYEKATSCTIRKKPREGAPPMHLLEFQMCHQRI